MDQRLKERLIGAVVLVALAVWLIPWLLDGPERESVAETVALELPAAEESAPVKTVTVDLDDRDRPGAQAGDAAVASDEAPAAEAERVPVAEADAEAAGTRATSAGEAGGAADAPAGASDGGGADAGSGASDGGDVDAGSGASDGGDADAGAGEPGSDGAEAAAGTAGAEVAVGNAGGDGAEAAADEAAVDEAGTGRAAGPSVPAGTASAGDWAVQLGSFGEIANAERLAARVETFGYEPEVSTHTAGGRELHRVRVGPQPSRARAEAVVSALTAHGFVAQVVTAD